MNDVTRQGQLSSPIQYSHILHNYTLYPEIQGSQTESELEILVEENEENSKEKSVLPAWKVLIVDDEPWVHDVSVLAMKSIRFQGRGIEFIHAFSGADAILRMAEHTDIALLLLDVIMETHTAGLEVVRAVREQQNNKLTRIVLRTGHPGMFPERQIVMQYDIDDYREKTSLVYETFFTLVVSSLRIYASLIEIEKNRQCLETFSVADLELSRQSNIYDLAKLSIKKIKELLILSEREGLDPPQIFVAFHVTPPVFLQKSLPSAHDMKIIATDWACHGHLHRSLFELQRPDLLRIADRALKARSHQPERGAHILYCPMNRGELLVFMVGSSRDFSPFTKQMLDLLCQKMALSGENILLSDELYKNQNSLIYVLSSMAEFHSKETSAHLNRVAHCCAHLGALCGLSSSEVNLLRSASPMHDIGKIGVPDAVLHKTTALNADEFMLMQSHVEIGVRLLSHIDTPMFRVARTIAYQHHERWDGLGYPQKLAKEEIDLMARMTTLVDVYDALSSARCYKPSWEKEKVAHYLQYESGRQFDPYLANHFLKNMDDFSDIRELYPDTPPNAPGEIGVAAFSFEGSMT